MLKRIVVALIAVVLPVIGAAHAHAEGALVDAAWLKANLGRPGVAVLDVRSGAGLTKAGFAAAHIPGSVYTDYAKDGWREKNAQGVEGMLPPPEKLERLVGGLGISNASHVVIVPFGRSAADVGTATRLYWTFKVLGHDKVSILNGGWVAWATPADPKTKQPLNPIVSGETTTVAAVFKAKLRREMLISAEEVMAAKQAGATLVDNRPHDFFVGLNRSPAAKRAGTIPGAKSLPEGWLTQNGGGEFRSKAQLTRLYQAQSIPMSTRQVTFCNTGHWASLGWFVASELLGHPNVVMYDGSMAEWTQDAAREVETRIKVD